MRKNGPAPVDLKRLGRLYSKRFPGANRHHPIPVSRMSRLASRKEVYENDCMVFPYLKKNHRAYHALFWNLRIDQIWDNRENIHRSIFNTNKEEIREWWKKDCDLEAGNFFERGKFAWERQNHLAKPIKIIHLRSLWFRAFGGEDLATAENLLKIMMLFMVFGPMMLDPDQLFDNGNLTDFFENTKPAGYRFWASQTLFGEGKSVRGIKSQIADILNRNEFYAP